MRKDRRSMLIGFGIVLLVLGVLVSVMNMNKQKTHVESNIEGNIQYILRTDAKPILDRMPKLGEIDKCIWRADVVESNERIKAPGPTDYWMEGYIFLNKSAIGQFKDQFSWKEVDKSWKPSFEISEIKNLQLNWKESQGFNEFILSGGYLGEFYIDVNNNIVFFHIYTM